MPNALPYKTLAPFSNEVKHVVGAIADVDLRTKQYLALARTTTGTLAVAGAGVAIVGVLQDKPNVGEECLVTDEGDCPAIAGAAVVPGAALEIDANGKFITRVSGVIVAYAVDGCSAANAQITVHLTP